MRTKWIPPNAIEYSAFLKQLHEERELLKSKEKRENNKRKTLKADERSEILKKTDCRCHICGGKIEGKWEADHILSHSKGGEHITSNYLPAHSICNNYRWDYLPEEFQEIMKLGILIRGEIEKGTDLGEIAAKKFVKHEIRRIKRRKNNVK